MMLFEEFLLYVIINDIWCCQFVCQKSDIWLMFEIWHFFSHFFLGYLPDEYTFNTWLILICSGKILYSAFLSVFCISSEKNRLISWFFFVLRFWLFYCPFENFKNTDPITSDISNDTQKCIVINAMAKWNWSF